MKSTSLTSVFFYDFNTLGGDQTFYSFQKHQFQLILPIQATLHVLHTEDKKHRYVYILTFRPLSH